jgi:hypothetical protein
MQSAQHGAIDAAMKPTSALDFWRRRSAAIF